MSWFHNFSLTDLLESPSASKGARKNVVDISVVNLNSVAEGSFLIKSVPKGEPPALPDYDRTKVNRRLQLAKDSMGIGVSSEAQVIFDHMKKTLSDFLFFFYLLALRSFAATFIRTFHMHLIHLLIFPNAWA